MESFDEKLKKFVLKLYEIGVLKFGDFKMKVGINSPVYCDLRIIISYPKLLDTLADLLCEYCKKLNFKQLCGVPYTALPIATLMSVKLDCPMLVRRKEQKAYGTKKLIEGVIVKGDQCLIVEDVVTSGSSILETVNDLRKEGLEVSESIVILDREQGGVANLEDKGIKMHSLLTMTKLMNILLNGNCIDQKTVDSVQNYIKNSQIYTDGRMKNDNSGKPKDRLLMPYSERLTYAKNAVVRKLFEIMETKQSNLCVAVDVTDTTALLDIAEIVGPHICLLKTHIDILTNFTSNFIQQLQNIAKKHNFLLLEDRKFADIGNTVKLQYSKGIYNIGQWADLVTVHSLPGPGILDGIKEAIENNERGVFLLAEMSSSQNLITNAYSNETIRIADNYKDIISGIVCQSKQLVTVPGIIQLTPGVQINCKQDHLGQQYNSPDVVVRERGADIAVVGRGITQAKDILNMTVQYKEQLWTAYKNRIVTK